MNVGETTGHSALVYAASVAATLLWGLSFVATKFALDTLPVFTVLFARFVIAACLFLPILLRQGGTGFTRTEHLWVFVTALFEPGLYYAFAMLGIKYTTAAKASLMIALVPVAVLVLARLALGERTTRGGVVGIAMSLVGVVVLVIGDESFQWQMGGHLRGDVFMLAAILTSACYTVSARRLMRTRSALSLTVMQTAYGSLFFMIPCLLELPDIQSHQVSVSIIAVLVYLGVFATFGAFFCYNYTLSKVSASRTAVIYNVVPVVTAIGAWLLLGERLTPMQLVGSAVVLVGVAVTNRAKAPVDRSDSL